MKPTYTVNGIRTPRPLKPASLSHVGLFYDDLKEIIKFYRDTLGLAVSDFGGRAHLGGAEAPKIVFVRAGTEHHCISLFPRNMKMAVDDVHMQHAAWNIRTYSELMNAIDFITQRGHKPEFLVRRSPGGNYAVYFLDPEGNRIELAYNLEAIGWQGTAKPSELWNRFLIEGALPNPPIKPVEEEIETLRKEYDYYGSTKCTYTLEKAYEILPAPSETRRFDTSGESRQRPFKIERIRYYALKCRNLRGQHKFYQEIMGLRTVGSGERGEVLMSVGFANEAELKLFKTADSKLPRLQKVCFEVRSYSELRGALDYLSSSGIEVVYQGRGESPELHNELCVDFADPSGNPIRLSFSPDANGLREAKRSMTSAPGLPSFLDCESLD